jgi:hypothetical protein
MTPLAVVALGGNALLRRGEPAEASHQQVNVRAAAQSIAALHGTHRLVVTHLARWAGRVDRKIAPKKTRPATTRTM